MARGELLALLGDAKAEPDEPGLRLVLADWLEDHGSPADLPRAECVRAQIARERLSHDDPAYDEAGRLGRELVRRHGKSWMGGLLRFVTSYTVRRGMVSLTTTAASLRASSMAPLADSEEWAWVEDVTLVRPLDEEIVRLGKNALLGGDRLSASPTILRVQPDNLTPAGYQALGRLPWVGRIVGLDFSGAFVFGDGLAALLASDRLDRLASLTVTHAQLPSAAMRHLAAHGPRWRRLDLTGNEIGDVGLDWLAEADNLHNLRSLDLRGNRISSALGLTRASSLAGLRELSLTDNAIDDLGARFLAQSRHLGGLTRLDLWGNPITQAGEEMLRGRFGGRVFLSPGSA